jgi:hypothetical protein
MNSKTLRSLGVLSFFLLSGTQILLKPEKSLAHVKCKVNHPFGGGWEEVCPHFHPPDPDDSGGSCTQSIVPPTKYPIENKTNSTINFSINDKPFSVDPGKVITISVGGGSNGCNAGSSAANISFDHSFADGSQRRGYSLSSNSSYYFVRTSDGIDLLARE